MFIMCIIYYKYILLTFSFITFEKLYLRCHIYYCTNLYLNVMYVHVMCKLVVLLRKEGYII